MTVTNAMSIYPDKSPHLLLRLILFSLLTTLSSAQLALAAVDQAACLETIKRCEVTCLSESSCSIGLGSGFNRTDAFSRSLYDRIYGQKIELCESQLQECGFTRFRHYLNPPDWFRPKGAEFTHDLVKQLRKESRPDLSRSKTEKSGMMDSDACVLFQLHEHPAWKFVEPDQKKTLETFRKNLCKYIEGKYFNDTPLAGKDRSLSPSMRRDLADRALRTSVVYSGNCSENFFYELDKHRTLQTIRLVFTTFCHRYNDNVEAHLMDKEEERTRRSVDVRQAPISLEEDLRRYADPYHWFEVEYFCAVSGYVASPGGWRGVAQPDIPATSRLENVADSLCNDVRSKTIKLKPKDAVYRWEQELDRFKRRLGPEVTKKGMHYLWDLLSNFVKQ